MKKRGKTTPTTTDGIKQLNISPKYKKIIRLLPWIVTPFSVFINGVDKYLFVEEAHLFSTHSYILIISFSLFILPYLIPVFSQMFQIPKVLNWISIKKTGGLISALLGAGIPFFLTVGGLVAAKWVNVGTNAPMVLIPQLRWPFYAERKIAANGGRVDAKVYTQYRGKTGVIKITFDTQHPDSYAGWMVAFPDVSLWQDWTKYPYVSFMIRSENYDVSHVLLGMKDINGSEVKKELSKFIIGQPPLDSLQWRSIEIDVTKLSSELQRPLDWQNLDNISFTLGHIDPDLMKDHVTFFVSELIFWGSE